MSRNIDDTDGNTAPHLNWIKATRSSSSSSCVEVAPVGTVVLVRDSKFLTNPSNQGRENEQPIIEIPASRWSHFLQLVLDGATAGGNDLPAIEYRSDGGVSLRLGPVELAYLPAEWDAFRDGIEKGEFDHFAAMAA